MGALWYAAAMGEPESITGLPWAKALTEQPCTPSQIVRLIEKTNWAAGLSAKELEALSRFLHVCLADKGAVIVREGGREAYLCLIAEGKVSIVKQGADRVAKQIGLAGVGRTVGEMSLIDGEPRSASVIAEEPTILVVLTGEGFANLSLEVPRLALKVLLKISKLISQRLRQTSGALVDYLEE